MSDDIALESLRLASFVVPRETSADDQCELGRRFCGGAGYHRDPAGDWEGLMNTARREINLGFTDTRISEGQHVVYVYSDDEERKRTMAKYLGRGLTDHEKVLYLVADISPEDLLGELKTLGVNSEAAGPAFDLLEEHYKQCPDAYFEPEFMLGVVAEYYQQAIKEGYVGARGAGEMSWAANDQHCSLRAVLGYEAELNAILTQHPLTTICQYDARRFSGEVIYDVLRVHPMAIVGGQLVRNPFYIEPADFLRELAERPETPAWA